MQKIKSNTNRDITLGKEDSRYLCTWMDRWRQMIKNKYENDIQHANSFLV